MDFFQYKVFLQDADRISPLLRQRDGLVGRVTVVRHELRRFRLHGDRWRRTWQAPAEPEFQLRSGGRGAAKSRP
jgi:hypothetical protein